MKVVLSTRNIEPEQRLAHWLEVTRDLYVDHDVKVENANEFDATLEIVHFGDLLISVLQTTAISIQRTVKHIGHPNVSPIFLCLTLEGVIRVQQNGPEKTLYPGDIIAIDSRLPCFFAAEDGSKTLSITMPVDMFEKRVGSANYATEHVVSSNEKVGGLVAGVLAMLPDFLPVGNETAEERLVDVVMELCALAYAQSAKRTTPQTTARSNALETLLSAIDDRLTDPQLTPAKVARAAGMSIRYANQLLAEQGTSIVNLVQMRRVEQCRRILANPANAHRTITEIAMSWGFSDLSHFGRRFKASVGMSPLKYRAQQKALRAR